MKYRLTLTAYLLAATTVQAEPYCAALASDDALKQAYGAKAPVYSDSASGWVFANDQLKDRYDMKETSRALIGDIVQEFKKRGVPLAIAVSPPRPIVAGQTGLDAARVPVRYDLAAAEVSFNRLIADLAATGAIVPNLLDVALMNEDVRDAFYFRRDSHWTTTGSALTAIALAEATNTKHPDLFPNDANFNAGDLMPAGEIEEEGSLAEIVREVCGSEIPPEIATTFDLTSGTASDLLSDTSDSPSVALVGSSFSDRYKRDHYRFADALARAFGAEISNYSVSGGGAIGAIEAYVLSGALDQREHELVIWEIPYTESFNSTSFLRQLLGALRLPHHDSPIKFAADETAEETIIEVGDATYLAGIEVVSDDLSKQDFHLEVHFDNGSTTKVSLRRKNDVPPEWRSKSLFSSLEHFGDKTPLKVTIRGRKNASVGTVNIFPGS